MFVVNDGGRGCAIPLSGTGWGRMERVRGAGGRAVKTTVEQTLMRGLVTAFPCVRPDHVGGVETDRDCAILLHGSSPMREARRRTIRRNPRSLHSGDCGGGCRDANG